MSTGLPAGFKPTVIQYYQNTGGHEKLFYEVFFLKFGLELWSQNVD